MHARGKQKHGTEVTHRATHYKKYLNIVYKIMKESIKSSSRCIVRIGKDEFMLSRTQCCQYRSLIHERTISFRFLGINLRVLRPEVSVFNVYITNQFQIAFAQGEGE
jgi:hypothetical protein